MDNACERSNTILSFYLSRFSSPSPFFSIKTELSLNIFSCNMLACICVDCARSLKDKRSRESRDSEHRTNHDRSSGEVSIFSTLISNLMIVEYNEKNMIMSIICVMIFQRVLNVYYHVYSESLFIKYKFVPYYIYTICMKS